MQKPPSPRLIGLDIGTSGARALAFTNEGVCIAEGRAPIATTYPASGRAEQHPDDWWQASLSALRDVSRQLGTESRLVRAIGLTGQCPTFTCLHTSGETIGPGLLYQDNRAKAQAADLIQRFGASTIHQRTGQAPSQFYILPKLLWLQRSLGQETLATSTVVQPRDFVGWHLTGRLATDPTHAACTLTYDLKRQEWAHDWLQVLNLETLSWPEVLSAHSILGTLTQEVATYTGLPPATPVIIGAADSISAAYGAQATETGTLCEVTGTSTCLHLTLEQPATAYAINTYPHVEKGKWYAEIGLNTTGGALAWLSALVKLSADDLLERAAQTQPGAEGLYFLPHLSGGERDDAGRCGAFIGLQLGHEEGQLARALIEGIAYALQQRVRLLEEAGYRIERIISCGGASRSTHWTQIKADILEKPITTVIPANTTAWGAALLAGQAIGLPVRHTPQQCTDVLPSSTWRERYRSGSQKFSFYEEQFHAHTQNEMSSDKS